MNIFSHISERIVVPLKIAGIDLSITNEILVMWIAIFCIILFFYFGSKKVSIVPNRFQNLVEMYVLTLWENIEPIVLNRAWLPFFCGLFSLILFCNLLGGIPGIVPPTVNINFTATLAVCIFLITQIVGIKQNGIRKYFLSFVPSNVPFGILIFIIPMEVLSQFIRPFSLSIRLFANIFAGHAVTLTIISLIFIFKSYWVIPGSLIGHLLISVFEIFVAFIQAFIFTFLSAFYIGSSLNLEKH
ncbi:ATP synthase F0 subunit A [candidate division WOR-1 bacterium RIFOXYA2_FULL_36_21]|uniref:ATP synthase subunit a n=1 Tax=candidate division WOR-1 bacterium RIFOXYB2_FULL_36_35 TaxID=1802578 RepID=A0A1F4RXR1_UNCSA|nr:MAG: ATP synthase F0 subunit A [candidate division WOR-1 bacterium RIFOXYA2_FULL_36_21]OGC12962.1 MAG: ATP synthase F0 subunit A [candidate division WOR-1 bacterium RIFOXYB2_FULL_36_35]OGC19990.1 MAG: ATP synthase F0 subunit A [candidate division WOR-1 bacterium RIFOXYA12_FULL_36_13]